MNADPSGAVAPTGGWSGKAWLAIPVLFVTLYVEPVSVAGVQWAHAWKAGFLVAAGLVLLHWILQGERLPVEWWGLLGVIAAFSLWPLHRLAAGDAPSYLIPYVGRRLFFFVSVGLAVMVHRRRDGAGVAWACLSLLSFSVPFMLGLEPLGRAYDLSTISRDRVPTFVGVFQNPHSAALAYSLATVGCLALALGTGREVRRRLWLIAAGVGLVLTVLTFARSGLVAVAAGAIVLLTLRRSAVFALRVGTVVGVAILAVVALLPDGGVLATRLLGQNLYVSDLSVDVISSGRTRFWTSILDRMFNGSVPDILFGVGDSEVRRTIGQAVGRELVPHNGFLYEFAAFGLLGLTFLVLMLGILAHMGWTHRTRIDGSALLALVVVIVAFGFFQSFDYPLHLALLALCLPVATIHSSTGGRGAG